MSSLKIGNSSIFAIESEVAVPLQRLSERGLGYFVLYVDGRCYGNRRADATLLACSLDAVDRRISRRGLHKIEFLAAATAFDIADSVRAATYDESRQGERFFQKSNSEFLQLLEKSEVIWAPDGDAAFDDGSHVLQFDEGEQVRLIAFRNVSDIADLAATIREAWIESQEFYEILEKWRTRFLEEWSRSIRKAVMSQRPGK